MQAKKLDYSQLSPFELKDELIRLAKETSKKSSYTLLNAGRGNPNWVATTPREAFFLLGRFAIQESKRVWDEPHLGGMPSPSGIADRLSVFLAQEGPAPGAQLLRSTIEFARGEMGFDLDSFVFELVDSIVGDNYPVPDRMLEHAEKVVHRYLMKEMCDNRPPQGRFDLFATEGGTAAMCYVFNTLVSNGILEKGDTIALGTPIFTPYLEIPKLQEFEFRTVEIRQTEMKNARHSWQYPEEEIRKLEDPKIKAFFVVNPSNPGATAMRPETIDQIVRIVKAKRRDLILLTDDVYGTFVPGFRSLAADLPRNTILVYSYSKHFGCTGWRLGVIALHEDNVIDEMIAKHPKDDRDRLSERYGTITLEPSKLKVIDRMVADSRSVALNHTAGLSLPQQVQMTLLSIFAMCDPDDGYKKRCQEIVHRRMRKLYKGLGVSLNDDPLRSYYYADLDLEAWARHTIGQEFVDYVKTHRDPLNIVFSMAEKRGVVLLNGSGFNGPPWSARVSLANLNDDDYERIGKDMFDLVWASIENWKKETGRKAA